MEISTPNGNKIIELVVDYSPILTFAPPVLFFIVFWY